MGKVKFLPETVINKIAAGEVVENPASVVKELIENSLDAGADEIIIEIKAGGKKLISVRDNGMGIEPDDIEKIFKRHATSKIERVDDLFSIKSLGFRGEALYSISSVSDVVLQSKAGVFEGREIHIRGGVKVGEKIVSRTQGTTIEVRELFFNTPARKKFLKSESTEFRRIVNIFLPYTIAFHKIHFSLIHNGKNIFDFRPVEDINERFCEVANIKKEYVLSGVREIKEKGVVLKIFLGDINLQFPERSRQYIFINNRPVYSRGISYTVNHVYEDIFPRGMYPAFCLLIQLSPADVDVNVHPAKREVKLKDETYIMAVLSDLCREIISKKAEAKKVSGLSYSGYVKETEKVPVISEGGDGQQLFNIVGDIEVEKGRDLRTKLKEAIYSGCYKNKYLFFDGGDVLFVIDQHAAHERINFELLKKQWESGKMEIQRLLTPLIIEMSYEEMSRWEEGQEFLETLGFLTTRWDIHSIAVHGFPSGIKNPEMSIRNILAENGFLKYDKEKLAKIACKGAVSAGEKITEEEAVNIKNELLKCETPFVCPHGRPTVVEFSESFFDRQFLR